MLVCRGGIICKKSVKVDFITSGAVGNIFKVELAVIPSLGEDGKKSQKKM